MRNRFIREFKKTAVALFAVLYTSGCAKESSAINDQPAPGNIQPQPAGNEALLLVIDEDCIDNGSQPNNFSAVDVNDQLATAGMRLPLSWFRMNTGRVITLYTGDVGDEGLHALTQIPAGWKNAGPTANGALNFLKAGPGLGSGANNPEILLDKVPGVTPLRATGLKMLTGRTVLAVVYDGDAAVNYNPLNASLMGATLGVAAFEVISVQRRTDGSGSALPSVTVRILSADVVSALPLRLFSNPPVPVSSSVPFDVNPPASAPLPVLVTAP